MVVFLLRLLGLLPWQPALCCPLHVEGGVKETGQTLLPAHPLGSGLSRGGWSLWRCMLKLQAHLSDLPPFVAREARAKGQWQDLKREGSKDQGTTTRTPKVDLGSGALLQVERKLRKITKADLFCAGDGPALILTSFPFLSRVESPPILIKQSRDNFNSLWILVILKCG